MSVACRSWAIAHAFQKDRAVGRKGAACCLSRVKWPNNTLAGLLFKPGVPNPTPGFKLTVWPAKKNQGRRKSQGVGHGW